MNILIVDDEKYVLEGIILGVGWDSLPFDSRYFARNAREAKEIMSQVKIHVLLCDIEMPQENGLDLLAWVREQKIELEAVFLTSYAEFDYAKRAIQLGSFDYYLKPIDYTKLTEILSKAAEKVSTEEEIRRNSELGEYWVSSEGERKATFWSSVMRAGKKPSMQEVMIQVESRKLPYDESWKFVILAIHLGSKNKSDWRDDGMTYYQLMNTYMECLEDARSVIVEALWKDADDLWFMVLDVTGEDEQLWKTVGGAASHMRKDLKKYYQEFAVYLSEEASLETVYEQTLQIRKMLFNNMIYGNGVFFVCDYNPQTTEKYPLDHKKIEEWFIDEKEEELKGYIDQIIADLGKEKHLSPVNIQTIILEWMQLVFLYLHKHQIEADHLFASDEYKDLYEKSSKTLTGCKEYLYYIVEESIHYGKEMKESEDVIEKIEQFIWEHLGDNLTRSSLTTVVYLNPDYLAHIFKKAKGISLIKYINNCRMEKAKELLRVTDENIYNIALQVGFPTSSYFAKQFKNYYGIGPSDYRKTKDGE